MGATQPSGYYAFRGSTGAVSPRFTSERLLTLSIASVLSGGAQRIDKFIDASAFVV